MPLEFLRKKKKNTPEKPAPIIIYDSWVTSDGAKIEVVAAIGGTSYSARRTSKLGRIAYLDITGDAPESIKKQIVESARYIACAPKT